MDSLVGGAAKTMWVCVGAVAAVCRILAYPFMCSLCGEMNPKMCCACFRNLGAVVHISVSSGGVQAAFGAGHCHIVLIMGCCSAVNVMECLWLKWG